jgi:hypothetical protein
MAEARLKWERFQPVHPIICPAVTAKEPPLI